MELRKTITTKLEKEHIESLKAVQEANRMTKRELFADALKYFVSKIPKNEIYEEKFNNFDRLHTDIYQLNIGEELVQKFNLLSESLRVPKFRLLREILLIYLTNKNKE